MSGASLPFGKKPVILLRFLLLASILLLSRQPGAKHLTAVFLTLVVAAVRQGKESEGEEKRREKDVRAQV